MLSPCLKALPGSPVPPGDGPSSLDWHAKPHMPQPCQLHPPAQLPGLLSSASLSMPLPRTPFPNSSVPRLVLIPRGSAHCQHGLRPATHGFLHPRPECALWPHACCSYSSRTCVWILCGQTHQVPLPPPPRKGPVGGPGMSPLPKASARTVAGIQEVAMATAGPSCHLLQSALGPSHPLGFLEICSL